jgi:hypothetical protein
MTPPRRWSFSLRMMFVVVGVLGCVLAWHVRFIHERHGLLAAIERDGGGYELRMGSDRDERIPPKLWIACLLGEERYRILHMSKECLDSHLDELFRLFPDAESFAGIGKPPKNDRAPDLSRIPNNPWPEGRDRQGEVDRVFPDPSFFYVPEVQ